MNTEKKYSLILFLIVIAQFFCTSLWFAVNGVMGELITNFQFSESDIGSFTSSVQFGFISGTLLFALLSITDRFSPSNVFFWSAVIGALSNLTLMLEENSHTSILLFRFITGFFLAGIYPVGMKIAADYFNTRLSKSLGLLVGALVLGTALPHALNTFSLSISWRTSIVVTSVLAFTGGLLVLLLVPDGPYRKAAPAFNTNVLKEVFKENKFKAAAFGYFGHMWELYAFWVFVPTILKVYAVQHSVESLNISLWSFIIIGIGSIACYFSGRLAFTKGERKVATGSLLLSLACCLALPFLLQIKSPTLFLVFMIFWGMVVIADSPLFSTLVAKNTKAETKGTALTIVNCIGFFVTILSIQLISYLHTQFVGGTIFLILAVGPFFGLFSLKYFQKKHGI